MASQREAESMLPSLPVAIDESSYVSQDVQDDTSQGAMSIDNAAMDPMESSQVETAQQVSIFVGGSC